MGVLLWLLVATATHGALADSHADICATQFNWWANEADNIGPPGYQIQTATEKLLSMAKKANRDNYSVCDMQKNANAYYYELKKKIKSNGQVGFPFSTTYDGTNNNIRPGFNAECKHNASATIGFDGPTASCAFGYPGQKDDPDFSDLVSICRLKIFGEKDKYELQWCMTDILKTMQVGKKRSYKNVESNRLRCPQNALMGEQGSNAFPPIKDAEYPSNMWAGPHGKTSCGTNHPSSPYESFAIIFRKIADTVVEGLCDISCDECQTMAADFPKRKLSCESTTCKDVPKSKKSNCKKACYFMKYTNASPIEACQHIELCPKDPIDSHMYTQPSNYYKKACNEVMFPSKVSTIPNTPSVWQKDYCFDNPDAVVAHDLALIGAGIGSAYVANELRYGYAHNRKISLFEAGDNVGGRLLSTFQAGALGTPVRPFDLETNVAPPEYGGMRISPEYELVFKQVIQLWEKYFKKNANKNARCTIEFCKILDNQYKCCEGLLTPMNVGNVAYHSTRAKLGPRLMSAKLKDPNPIYEKNDSYSIEDIENYATYSPYIQCVLLVVGVNHYYNQGFPTGNAVDGFENACAKPACAVRVSENFCKLCDLFAEKERALSAVSCSGYDTDPNIQLTQDVIGLMDEVVNIKGKTHLYLFTVGYQRLAQELLSGTMSGDREYGEGPDQYNTLDIAPHFRKKLVAVGVGPGHFDKAVTRARQLAYMQVRKYTKKNTSIKKVQKSDHGPIRLKFDDGSLTTVNMAYLTMLPFDAVDKVQGLEPWSKYVHKVTAPTSAFKAVLAWDTFSLADRLNLKPCVVIKEEMAEGGLCDRIILDGQHTGPNGQVVRQAWLWDYKQILLYQVGGDETPAVNGIDLTTEYGMNIYVQQAVSELQLAVEEYNITIPPPTWFRSKAWPNGSLMPNWALGVDGATFSNLFRRPFGDNVNTWYGNSEMAAKPELHGWAEGAFSMAETNLLELKKKLGQKPALRVRRSLRELEADHRIGTTKPLDDLMNAWYGIKNLSYTDLNSFFVIGGYHGMPFEGKGRTNRNYWGGYCNHGNVLFPTWHRAYLFHIEKALQSFEPDVMMPYWDETSHDSLMGGIPWSLTQAKYTFVNGTTITNPLLSFKLPISIIDDNPDDYNYTKLAGYETKRYPLSGLWSDKRTIQNSIKYNKQFVGMDLTGILNDNVKGWLKGHRGKNITNGSIYCNYENSLNTPSYTLFSNTRSANNHQSNNIGNQKYESLESPHGEIHLSVGGYPFAGFNRRPGRIIDANGDMGENENAAMDPIFFFHHCFVDKLFWKWQTMHSSTNHLTIDSNDPGAKVNHPSQNKNTTFQGPAVGQTFDQALNITTPLIPFKNNDGTYVTSNQVTNIESGLGYTYSTETPMFSSSIDCNPRHDHGKKLVLKDLDHSFFKGSFVVRAYLSLDGPWGLETAELIGHSSYFGTYRTPSTITAYTDHIFSLEAFSEDKLLSAKEKVAFFKFDTHGIRENHDIELDYYFT